MSPALLLYQSANNTISTLLKQGASTYEEINFIDTIKKHSQEYLYKLIEDTILSKNIQTIFMLQNNSDSSINIHLLQVIKEQYHLKIVCIFLDSINSFEFIDRYYAQLAELVLLDTTPFITKLYTMLEIQTATIPSFNTRSKLRKNNFFSTSLTSLSNHIVSTNNTGNIDIFYLLKNSSISSSKLLLDKKFILSQEIYEIYWSLYHLLIYKRITSFFHLCRFKNIKHIISIIKLSIHMFADKDLKSTKAIEIINVALYQEYNL